MSDDEEITYVKRQKIVHYGSLEEKERQRLAAQDAADEGSDEESISMDLRTAIASGNINISEEYMEMEEEVVSRDKQQLLEEFERKKKARQINVSTDDTQVKATLRELEEPICLFGEGPAERRERLRHLLAQIGQDAIRRKQEEELQREREARREAAETTWYHESTQELRKCRVWIARYSLPRARMRIARAREEPHGGVLSDSQIHAKRQELYKTLRSVNISCSQIGDTRPISFCEFSPNSEMLATASWSGICKLWSIPQCQLIRTLRGHNCNVGAIVFHPRSTGTLSAKSLNMASCSSDGIVNFWNLESEEPISSLKGMCPHRVSRVAFHPSGRFLACCVFDNSWRLVDLETEMEVLHQEGHSKAVYDISFQCDGSLAATGGMDAFGRIWDLRTGRCIMFLDGHLKSVLSLSFSPNGYELATGSEDNTIKVWDLRQRKCEYTIPAHTNLVSRVIFEKNSGEYLVTTSYDNTIKIWSNPEWTPIRNLSGHDGRIMGADISQNGKYLATSSFDRTFKLWMPE